MSEFGDKLRALLTLSNNSQLFPMLQTELITHIETCIVIRYVHTLRKVSAHMIDACMSLECCIVRAQMTTIIRCFFDKIHVIIITNVTRNVASRNVLRRYIVPSQIK